MWLVYRLWCCCCLLLACCVCTNNVQGSRITRPDSSNSIADELDSTADVLNDELLAADDSRTGGNRSVDDNSTDGSGAADGQVISFEMEDNSTRETTTNEEIIDWSTTWPYFNTGCAKWLPMNHVYFQLANTFLFLSYLAPAGLYGLIYLRAMLAIGCAFFAIWGWLVICAFDTFVWNALFCLINLVHGTFLLFTLRTVRFDDQVEEVYTNVFQPLKVSKQQFKKIVKCMKQIQALKRGELFAIEKQTKVETLSLLLSGSMLVIENGRTLHVLHPMQFLDSPEWFGVSSDDYFQVSIRACEESRVMTWHRDKLKLTLDSDPFLQAVFDHILGRDVVRKLTQMKEKIAGPAGNNSPFRNNLLTNSGIVIDNEKSAGSPPSMSTYSSKSTVAAEHEYESLLGGENAGGKKSKSNLIGSGPSPANLRKIATVNPQTGIPADRYDYSKDLQVSS